MFVSIVMYNSQIKPLFLVCPERLTKSWTKNMERNGRFWGKAFVQSSTGAPSSGANLVVVVGSPPPNHPFVHKLFHYEPSILGFSPYFSKHPCDFWYQVTYIGLDYHYHILSSCHLILCLSIVEMEKLHEWNSHHTAVFAQHSAERRTLPDCVELTQVIPIVMVSVTYSDVFFGQAWQKKCSVPTEVSLIMFFRVNQVAFMWSNGYQLLR